MKKLLTIILLFSFCLIAEGHRVNKPILGTRINWAHPLSKGLVGYWLMNEGVGNKVYDLSGNQNIGSLVGDTHFVPGKFGPALDFDGTGDYVGLNTVPSLGNSNTYSIILQIKTIDNGHAMWGYGQGYTISDTPYIIIGKFTDNKAFYSHRADDKTTALVYQTGPTINDGNWHQLCAIRYAQNSFALYLDGKCIDISNISPGVTTLNTANIGVLKRNTFADYFNGQIDHVMIFNRALTAGEIQQLYREPFCMFEPSYEMALFKSGEAPPAVTIQPIINIF